MWGDMGRNIKKLWSSEEAFFQLAIKLPSLEGPSGIFSMASEMYLQVFYNKEAFTYNSSWGTQQILAWSRGQSYKTEQCDLFTKPEYGL